jgi:hypothetical protein
MNFLYLLIIILVGKMPRIRTFCISALSPGQQKTFWALTEMKIYTFLPEDRSERIHLDYYIVLNVGATQGYVSPKEHLLLHHAILWVFLLSHFFNSILWILRCPARL